MLKVLISIVVAPFILAHVQPVAAQHGSYFYKGKTITLLIGSSSGGGYDSYARVLARHMSEHIPGNPLIVPRNMPGAGSFLVANFIVNVAPRDGTVIGAFQHPLPLMQIMGEPGATFEAKNLEWLGSLGSEADTCAVATRTGVNSFADVFNREFTMGGTGPNVTQSSPTMLNSLLGAKFKIIKGYPGSAEVYLAIERGEVDGVCQAWSSFERLSGPMLTEGKIKPLVQMSFRPYGEMTKRGVSMLEEFITPERVQPGYSFEEVKTYLTLVNSTPAMGRPYAVAPGVPQSRIEMLRAAFSATAKDKKFLEDAKKANLDIDLLTGTEVQEIVQKMAATPKDKLVKLNDLFRGQTP